jgi:integrase
MTTTTRRDFGRIYLRGRVYWIRYRVDGKEYVETTRSESLKEAERVLNRRQAELGLGVFTAPDVKRTTFADLAQMIRDDYAANKRKSGSRLDISLAHLERAFGSARAHTLTADRLTAYARDRRDLGAAPATIRNELNALKRAFRLAKRAGKVASIPEFPQLAAANVRQGFFEAADFHAVLAELPEALGPVVEFAYLTGWRKSEILGLTWDRVDFSAGVVRLDVGSTKTGQGRTFPFKVLPALATLLDRQRTTTRTVERRTGALVRYVFHRDGARIRDFYTAWHAACQRAAVERHGALERIVRPALLGRVPHDFRRTAVRNLVRAGVPEHIAMKLTGHRTRDIFDRYDIVNEADLSDGVTRLATFLQAKQGGEK